MAKLKHIVCQLSIQDYNALQAHLTNGSASKSCFLLQALRDQRLGDRKIMQKLSMSTNAYYTLCSRLGQKIENYLLSQMETPRTTLLRKVANLHEVVFKSNRTIALTTLKKIEKELIDYGLSVELTVVYKYLKKLYAYREERFTYSQRYNQQITYMLAMDKSETLLMDYFRSYGSFYLQQAGEHEIALRLHRTKMQELFTQHSSHRLYVHQAALNIFHRLYVEKEIEDETDNSPTEYIFKQVYDYFEQYKEDPIYPHYVLLFDFLKLAYYHRYGIQRKVEYLYDDMVQAMPQLLAHYNSYTFPSQFLWIVLSKHLRASTPQHMDEQNKVLFAHYRPEKQDVSNYLSYVAYRSICAHYAGDYKAAASWIQQVFNEISLKAYTRAQMELKILLALQYVLLNDYGLFTQTINSLQRHMRLTGRKQLPHLVLFVKILKLSTQDSHKNRETRIKQLIKQMPLPSSSVFTPISLLRMDDNFVKQLCKAHMVPH